jgi:hypothetical protein
VCEWDDVVVARLTEDGCGGVRWSGRGVDGYGVGEVAGREEGALEDILARGTRYFNAELCQLIPRNYAIETGRAYRDPTALYKSESVPMTSLFDPGPALRFGVATFPATLLRLLSAMTVLLLCLSSRRLCIASGGG